MKRLILGGLGLFLFYQQAWTHEFWVYCYSGSDPGANPLECYYVWEFDENTITWNNRPQPGVLVATVNSVSINCWYIFSSLQLDQYIDSCVANSVPTCFRVKRQIQSGQTHTVWRFYSKEESAAQCARLIYNAQTYTPPQGDARVYEYFPNDNYCCDFLWVCNYESPQRQELFVKFAAPPAGVEEDIWDEGSRLLRSAPSPFSSFTYISYNVLPEDAGKPTHLAVYDITGNLVRTLVKSNENTGRHEVVWDGKDANGIQLPNGCYFYRLKIGEVSLATKGLLLR